MEDTVLRFMFENKAKKLEIGDVVSGVGLPESDIRIAMISLRKKGMIEGPALLIERVTEALKGDIEPTAQGYAEHIILLASAMGGSADETFLAKELSFDKEFVGLVGSRLRSAGIWNGDKLSDERMKLWANDALTFFLDAAVATGNLMVVGGSPDNREYQMTDTGKTTAANLVKRIDKEPH